MIYINKKNILFKSQIIFYSLILVLCSIILSGCSQEPSSLSDEDNVDVIFSIPDTNGLISEAGHGDTRAVDLDGEFYFNNIYLVAYQTKDNEEKTVSNFRVISLSGRQTGSGTTDNNTAYRDYKVSLSPGYYRFYMLVNFDRYLNANGVGSVSNVNSEEELTNLITSFNPSVDIIEGHIPMVCKYTEMKSSSKNNYTNLITVNKVNNNPTITAPLSVLCSKIRYTILFNAYFGGISEAFGSERIRFDVNASDLPYATNLGSYPNTDFFTRKQTLPIDKFEYPSKDNYPSSASDLLVAWPTSKTLEEWYSAPAKAWQGVVYLPINNQTDKTKKTSLHFPYCYGSETNRYGEKSITLFDGSNDSKRNGGLEGGKMYDLVIKVKTPDELEYSLKVYSLVEDWHDVDQDIIDEGWLNNGNSPEADLDIEQKEWLQTDVQDKW